MRGDVGIAPYEKAWSEYHKKRKDRRGGLRSFFYLYDVDGRIQKEIDQFIAGAICFCGQFIQTGDQLILHADGYDFITVIAATVGFFCDFDNVCHIHTSFISIVYLDRREISIL